MSKSVKVNMTTNYDMFHVCENRPINEARHKKLRLSMQQYGFLKGFPIVCVRDGKGRLVVKDGQHRLAFARLLRLPVWWIEEDVDFDIATINSTSRIWVLRDYADRFAQAGNKNYAEGIDFAATHKIPLGTAFAMLAGTISFGNIEGAFTAGDFKVKERGWAEMVAATYGPLTESAPGSKSQIMLLACMAVCRVPDFDPKRLAVGAQSNPGLLKPFAQRDEYLTVFEELYNHKRNAKNRVPLKFMAIQAMADRGKARGKKNAEPVAA